MSEEAGGPARVLMSDPMALRTKHYYVCNVCWGDLEISYSDEKKDQNGFLLAEVHCQNPDCSGTGFVTRKYSDRRRDDSAAEYWEAYQNLAEILGLKKEQKSAEQSLKELGF